MPPQRPDQVTVRRAGRWLAALQTLPASLAVQGEDQQQCFAHDRDQPWRVDDEVDDGGLKDVRSDVTVAHEPGRDRTSINLDSSNPINQCPDLS
jgi:hypothetical protein